MLQLEKVCKTYCNVEALHNFSFTFQEGNIYSVIGENGAGKTTLINLLSGAIRPTSGQIYLDGQKVQWNSCANAVENGIFACHQDPSVFNNLSVVENLFLGHELKYGSGLLDWKKMNQRARELLDIFSLDLPLTRRVKNLSLAEKHIIQFLRVYIIRPRVIILDELTDAMTLNESGIVYSQLRSLSQQGCIVILVTHRIPEALSDSDCVVVLRDGALAESVEAQNSRPEDLAYSILGDAITKHYQYPKLSLVHKDVLLEVDHISNHLVKDISFTLHKGESIGITGLAGSGRTSLLRAIVGLDKVDSGSISLHHGTLKAGKRISPQIAFLPENREEYGIFPLMQISQNITIRSLSNVQKAGFLQPEHESIISKQMIDTLGIKTPGSPNAPMMFLSDGNKQKVLIARNLLSKCSIFVLDEPTKGVDTAGKVEIYNIINELLRKSAGVIIVSSDFSELSGMCDRLLLIKKGTSIGMLEAGKTSPDLVFSMFAE